jgi:hypothetical protein
MQGGTFVRMPEGDNGFTSRMRTEASAAMSVLSSLYTVSGHSSSGVKPSFSAASTPLRHAVNWHDLTHWMSEHEKRMELTRRINLTTAGSNGELYHLCPSNSSLGKADFASSAEAGGT